MSVSVEDGEQPSSASNIDEMQPGSLTEFWNMWNSADKARIRAILEHQVRKTTWISRHIQKGGVTK